MIKNTLKFFKKNSGELKPFYNQLKLFKKMDTLKRFPLNDKSDIYPCLNDNTINTNFDAHYIYHPAWAARIIKELQPEKHVDISSTLHFCTILSAFVTTEFYDYRPAVLTLNNLSCRHANLTSLPFESDSIFSMSCMHTIEHIGLGRYGDLLDPEGDLKAIAELKRVCAKKGNLLIVIPVGIARIQFNAHRIYNPHDLINYMDGFKLNNFSFVNDDGVFVENADLENAAKQTYACGCYWFIKDE